MWLVEFSLTHRIPAACFPCHKMNKISISWLNYNRKQEILLKNLLQNQQNLKACGIYSCTGIYFFKSAKFALTFFKYLLYNKKQTKYGNNAEEDEYVCRKRHRELRWVGRSTSSTGGISLQSCRLKAVLQHR